jgi:class 3 adenylate cyclase
MSDRGDSQLERFMGRLDEIETGVTAFERLLHDVADPDERSSNRLARLKRGLSTLRKVAAERLDPAGFDADVDNAPFSRARHDLRNSLNPVSLACQGLLRGLSRSNGSSALLDCLVRIQEHIDESVIVIDEFGQAHSVQEVEQRSEDPKYTGRLLVVDDSAEEREELVETLRDAGHTVVCANDGDEALRILDCEDGDYDVVLLDLSMPGKDGKFVLQRLREEGKLKFLPVIVVTGRRGEDDVVECISVGAEGFLTKPVRARLLMAEVDRCLEKRRLREREFEQFFPPAVARHFARHPDSSEMEAKSADVSVLFCDIRGFSGISERLGGLRTMPWLRDVLECFSQCVLDNDGVLVDYTGDEVMAMWGAPRDAENHAELACRSALAMLSSLSGLNKRWQAEIGCETDVGIGINSGTAYVGNVGTRRRLKYGPLGNTVNLASRVQGATSYAKTRLVISEETRAGLPEEWHSQTRRLCEVRVKNIVEPVRLFELVDKMRSDWKRIKSDYEQALEEFQQTKFPSALETLGNLLQEHPEDGPSLLLMGRVVEAMSNDHEPFDPIWELPGKSF